MSTVENLLADIKDIATEADYSELYGIDLVAEGNDEIKKNLLAKFAKANHNDLAKAKTQLIQTLEWRRKFKPLSAAFEETHSPDFEKLGYILEHEGVVSTWNVYGAIEDRAGLFKQLDEFVRWRVGLMEQGIKKLDLANPDKSAMVQVHDYMGVSFWRLDAPTRSATRTVVDLFQNFYPELLNTKYFVNVPVVMGWMMQLSQAFVSKETVSKYRVLANGRDLAKELGSWVPSNYGGNGDALYEKPKRPDSKIFDRILSLKELANQKIAKTTHSTAATATNAPESDKTASQDAQTTSEDTADKLAQQAAAKEKEAQDKQDKADQLTKDAENKSELVHDKVEAPAVAAA